MHVIAPVSTCRSKNAKGEWVEKVYDHVIACNSLKGTISQMNVVEDVESRPHKAVSFALERGKGRQEWNETARRRYLDVVEEGCQEGAQKKKGREEGEEDSEETGTKSLKK